MSAIVREEKNEGGIARFDNYDITVEKRSPAFKMSYCVPIQALKIVKDDAIDWIREKGKSTKNLCMKKARNVTYRSVGQAINYRYQGIENSRDVRNHSLKSFPRC